MKTIKIFLASSNELKHEREQFKLQIASKNTIWKNTNFSLQLDIWEDLSNRISQTRSQDEYNTKIKEADVFVLLAYSKVGMYTEEEFVTAFGTFKATNKPFIFTYFKDIDTAPEQSLDAFKNKLKELGHFYAPYTTFDNLWNQCNKELDRLLLADFTENEQPEKNSLIQIDNKGATITTQNNIINNTVNYGNKKIRKQLGSIPVNPEVFIGRDRSTKEIHTQLTNKESLLLLVNGQGGIGKTTLASQYYFDYFEYYTHLIWLFAENGIQNTLLSLALPLQIQFPTQATQEQQLDLIIRELSELTSPTLLVIDNANSLEDLGDSYTALRKFKNIDILLTSRIEKYKSIPTYKVKHLSKQAANSLFKKYYTSFNEGEQSLLDRLLEAIGYNTLVIELLSKNLSIFNTGLKERYPLQKLLEDIQNKGLLQLTQSAQVDSDYQSFIKATPEAIISVMYDITSLNEEEKKVLSIFGVLPATAILFSDLEQFLPTIQDLDKVLLGLSQKGWIEYNIVQQSFKNNPIVAEITREQNKERIPNDIETLILVLINLLIYEPNTGHIKGDFEDIIRLVSFAEIINSYNKLITYDHSILYDRLGNFYQTYGSLTVAEKHFKLYVSSREEFHKEEPENIHFTDGLSIAYSRLGALYIFLRDIEQAEMFVKKHLSLVKELHFKDSDNILNKYHLALAYSQLVDIYIILKNFNQAKEFSLKELSITKELYINDPSNIKFKNGLAVSYGKLGDININLREFNNAKKNYLEGTILIEDLLQKDVNNINFKNVLAIFYEKLGDVYINFKKFNKAKEFYSKETSLIEELYIENPTNIRFKNGLASASYKLGNLYVNHLGQQSEGSVHLIKAKEILEELATNFPEHIEFKKNYAFIIALLNNLEEE